MAALSQHNTDPMDANDSEGDESIDAELLAIIEGRKIERWPLDTDMTRVVCSFVPRRYAQCACISRCFRDQREALRRGEARTALAAVVPVQLAAAIEAVKAELASAEAALEAARRDKEENSRLWKEARSERDALRKEQEQQAAAAAEAQAG